MRDRYIYRWGFVWRVKALESRGSFADFISVYNKVFWDQQIVLQNLKATSSYGGPF